MGVKQRQQVGGLGRWVSSIGLYWGARGSAGGVLGSAALLWDKDSDIIIYY